MAAALGPPTWHSHPVAPSGGCRLPCPRQRGEHFVGHDALVPIGSRDALLVILSLLAAAGLCDSGGAGASSAPRLSVTPAAHLHDGQLVTVAGSRADALFGVWECPTGARKPEIQCDQRNWTTAVAGDSADFHIEFAVSSIVYPQRGVNTNCMATSHLCDIVVAAFHSTRGGLVTDGITARVPLTFDRQQATRYVDPVFGHVNVVRNQIYRPAGNGRGVGLDIYEPAGDQVKERPTIVWIHGGSFQVGDKAEMAQWATDWARRGYVAVSINYRLLSIPSPGDAAILRAANDATDDATFALAWLRSNSKRFHT